MPIKALPSMEHTFTLSVKGSETGRHFDGTFKYKRPNIRTQAEIAKTAAILDGGLANLDEDTKFLNAMLARLKHTIIEHPEWWAKEDYGYELYDVNVLFELYKECDKFEKDWFEKVWSEEAAEDVKASPAPKKQGKRKNA